ncbi:MAG: peptidoglycan DD-metalloendopeptidase family protein [Bacteroidales bacterium]|nr:peptidoglycan DD-metalloendopeptidase family protein [Bacteroidales bacterium]
MNITYAQTKEELEKRKVKTQEEIAYTNRLLEETQQKKQSSLNRVRIINKRIQLRNQLLRSINQEISLYTEDIENKRSLIDELETDMELVKRQYEMLVQFAFWNKDKNDRLMFVLSADNFNMAYKRMKYIQQYTRHRKEQALLILSMQSELKVEIKELEEIVLQKEALARQKAGENRNLEREKQNKDQMVMELSGQEKKLKSKIEENRKIARRLEKEIAAIITAEASKGRSRNMYDQLTPEEKLISDNFMGNKGKLPWPTERGVVTSRFGKHQHAVLKQVTVQNDGIDISTVQGAEARALFDGVVSKVVAILGANYTVIMRHGNFLTVYQNLINVRVKPGEEVMVKQVLGTVFTEEETNSTLLHIEIWKELNKQNPEDWLSRK